MRDLLGFLPIIRRGNADYVLTKIQITCIRGCVCIVRRVSCRKKKEKETEGEKVTKGDIA